MKPISPIKLIMLSLLTSLGLLTLTPAAFSAELSVKGVSAGDVLSVRKYPGVKSKIIAQIPPDGTGLIPTGKRVKKGRSVWAQIKWKTQTGWVNTRYTTPSKSSTKAGSANKTSANSHTHPANRCTRSITHSHPNGKRPHKHHYSCLGNKGNKKSSDPNAHTHPANKCTRSITHTHPNGKRKHVHHYSCLGNRKANTGNGHRHPANRCTRSIFHSHPNGKRKHVHRYSCK